MRTALTLLLLVVASSGGDVDSYGDVLHDVTEPVDEATVEQLAEAVGTLSELSPGDAGPGCTGGTGREIRADDADGEVLDLQVEVCDDDEAEASAERIDEAIEPITDLLDMDALLADG